MKTTKTKIVDARLREIIIEEIKSLHEAVDHEGVRGVVNCASKLLKAIEAFEKDINATMTNSMTPNLGLVKSTLENMIASPAAYVDKPIKQAKTIQLRQIKDKK